MTESNHSQQIKPLIDNRGCKLGIVKKPTKEEMLVTESEALFEDMDSAVKACVEAQKRFKALGMTQRKLIIQSIRDTCKCFAADFALCANTETGRGRFEDKYNKQLVAIDSTPGVEDLTPRMYTGDHGMTGIDYAPFGVIGAVTPVTNPTATVINNSITILSGGNGVVFNPHPGATICTNRAVAVVNQAIVQAGGPSALVASVKVPTIPSGQCLMTHPLTAANLITGGPAVVKVALSSGKRSFCAGPGNPPVVVDETADLAVAANGIYYGATFDNNMICSDEKEVFVVESVADRLIQELIKTGAHLLTNDELQAILKVAFAKTPEDNKHGEVARDLVGLDASVLAQKAGFSIPESCRLMVADVPSSHPLVWTEQLMPIMPIVRVPTFQEAVDLAKAAEYDYKHTASIYSSNLNRITEMSTTMNTSIFCVNGSHTAGLAVEGEGYTSFSIAGTTGEGMTRPSTFVRERRLVCCNSLHFV